MANWWSYKGFFLSSGLFFIALIVVCQFHQRLENRLSEELVGTEIWVEGEVASLPEVNPDYTRFLFSPTKRQAQLAGLPALILVSWYQPTDEPVPGNTRRFKLRLKPPAASVNFQGYDRERSLLAAGIGALATVLESKPASNKPGGLSTGKTRAFLREKIQTVLPEGQPRALVLSLLIADRSELSDTSWTLLRITGTGHLLAISGLHIGLAAIFGFWLTRVILVPLTIRRGSETTFRLCCIGSMLIALTYGVLAGFPVSTLRALIMLGLATWLISSKQSVAPIRIWLMAIILVIIFEPLAYLTAGFWLSFAAVLGLVLYFAPRRSQSPRWLALPRAQFAVMAITIPLGAFWFQSGSILAMPANLIAIPWVSFISVPLVLLSAIAYPLPGLFEGLLWAASWSLEAILAVLKFISHSAAGRVKLTPDIGLMHLMLACVGGLVLLMPAGIRFRWVGLCMACTLFLPRISNLDHGEYSIETLDVGQGLAVIVRTRSHMMLYDTGPGDGINWSLAESTVAPALRSDGRSSPNLIAVSHADLDHAGGLADLRTRFPDSELIFNQRHGDVAINGCTQDQSWQWDGVSFEVLHPSAWLPYQGNDSSCVISIDNGDYRSLLTGDISDAVENRLAWALDTHDFMTVPHHGSTTSSSMPFLDANDPSWAVVSAARGNRFNFPRPEVVNRYLAMGTRLFSTSDCGAVLIEFRKDTKPAPRTARNAGFAPWRWNANDADCMVTPDSAMYHLHRPKLKE